MLTSTNLNFKKKRELRKVKIWKFFLMRMLEITALASFQLPDVVV
jgi:hypothetical protein